MTLFCAGDIKWNVHEKDKLGRLLGRLHNLHPSFPPPLIVISSKNGA